MASRCNQLPTMTGQAWVHMPSSLTSSWGCLEVGAPCLSLECCFRIKLHCPCAQWFTRTPFSASFQADLISWGLPREQTACGRALSQDPQLRALHNLESPWPSHQVVVMSTPIPQMERLRLREEKDVHQVVHMTTSRPRAGSDTAEARAEHCISSRLTTEKSRFEKFRLECHRCLNRNSHRQQT